MRKNRKKEKGYVLLGVLLLTMLALVISVGMLDSSATNAKTRAVVNTQMDYYYEVEETLNKTVGWLQQNSKYILDAFLTANFNTHFDFDPAVAATIGSNEGLHFSVPTMVKMAGTTNSVMLSNNAFFGTDAFPAVNHIDTNAAFDAIAEFDAADLGSANARIILVWVRQTTDTFEPIFRIDVVTGNNPDRGVHSFSYVYSTVVDGGGGTGFYGEDYLEFGTPNNDCYSYNWTHNGTNWNKGAQRANCPIASDGDIDVKSKINGTGKTLKNNGINLLPPGGTVSGATCEGAGCHSYNLPALGDWNSYCGGGGASMTISSDTPIAPGCYDTITINNNRDLQLFDRSAPYYIREIDFQGNFSNIDFGSIPVGDTVELFVEDFNGTHLNGNRLTNTNNAPHQFELNYLGTDELKLNGTADLNAMVTSPYATVDVRGTFNLHGGVLAKELTIGGTAKVNFDESATPTTAPSDINFALRKTSQRYR